MSKKDYESNLYAPISSGNSKKMQDTLRRIYLIHLECGGNINPIINDFINKKEEEKSHKKIDNFEIIKVKIVNDITKVRSSINNENFVSNTEFKHNVRVMLAGILQDIKELERLNIQAEQKKDKWIYLTKPIDPEILKIRKSDVIKLYEHYRQLQKYSIGKTNKLTEEKNFRKIDETSLNDFNNDNSKDDNLNIDISEGLQQIENNKRFFEKNLLKINRQIDEISGIAIDMSDELDKQTKLLDVIDNDVTKYNSSLSKLNLRMDSALNQTGGSTRMIFIVFGMIACLVLLVVVYIVFEVYLKDLIDKVFTQK